MVNIDQPFDLGQILITEIIGNLYLFIAIALIIIVIFALRNNVKWQLISLMCMFFLLIVYSNVGSAIEIIYVLIGLFIVFIFYFPISRLMNRG